MVLGMKINTGKEAWAMHASKLGAQIREEAKVCDIQKAQDFAKVLGNEFKSLKNIMDTKGMIVGDLQILVRPNGKITIIDPLDVLQMVPKDPNDPTKGVDLIDVVNPDNPNSMGFMKSLMESAKMIDQVINFCDSVCRAKDLQALEKAINPSVSSRYTGLSFPSGRPPEPSGRNAFSEPSTPVSHRREVPSVRAATSMPSSPQQRLKTEPVKKLEPKPVRRPEKTAKSSSKRSSPLTHQRDAQIIQEQQESHVKKQKASAAATSGTLEEPKTTTSPPKLG
jgi:hypothetical protein